MGIFMADQPAPEPDRTGASIASDVRPEEAWARDAAIFFPPIQRTWSDLDTYAVTRRIQAALYVVSTPEARFKS
jgi:hypothetical protein